MRVSAIATSDIIKASIGGRVVYGEVLEIRDGVVHFNPISPAAGWRHASAHQIIGHWRKAGRRPMSGSDEDNMVPPPEQLSLRVNG